MFISLQQYLFTSYQNLQGMVNVKRMLLIMPIVSAFIVSINESYVNAIQNNVKLAALLIIKWHASVKLMKGKTCSPQFYHMFWLYITKIKT